VPREKTRPTAPACTAPPGSGAHSAHLQQELVPPVVEALEALGGVDVVDQHAAVRAAVERDAEGLEALLARRIPDLGGGRVGGVWGVSGSAGVSCTVMPFWWSTLKPHHCNTCAQQHSRHRRGAGSRTPPRMQQHPANQRAPTCNVTSLSSSCSSLVRKSAPMVALYSFENFFCTYWFMSDVLPTLWRCCVGCGRRGSGGVGGRCFPLAVAACAYTHTRDAPPARRFDAAQTPQLHVPAVAQDNHFQELSPACCHAAACCCCCCEARPREEGARGK